MYIQDRLFSEAEEEVLYSVLMDEDEYALFCEVQREFSKMRNLTPKQINALAKNDPELMNYLKENFKGGVTKENSTAINSFLRDRARDSGVTNKVVNLQNKGAISAENTASREASTMTKHLGEGRNKEILESVKHATNPEAEMKIQKEISNEIGSGTGQQTKEGFKKNVLEKKMEKVSEDVEQAKTRGRGNNRRAQKKSGSQTLADRRRAHAPKSQSVSRVAESVGRNQQAYGAKAVKDAVTNGSTVEEAIHNVARGNNKQQLTQMGVNQKPTRVESPTTITSTVAETRAAKEAKAAAAEAERVARYQQRMPEPQVKVPQVKTPTPPTTTTLSPKFMFSNLNHL